MVMGRWSDPRVVMVDHFTLGRNCHAQEDDIRQGELDMRVEAGGQV